MDKTSSSGGREKQIRKPGDAITAKHNAAEEKKEGKPSKPRVPIERRKELHPGRRKLRDIKTPTTQGSFSISVFKTRGRKLEFAGGHEKKKTKDKAARERPKTINSKKGGTIRRKPRKRATNSKFKCA